MINVEHGSVEELNVIESVTSVKVAEISLVRPLLLDARMVDTYVPAAAVGVPTKKARLALELKSRYTPVGRLLEVILVIPPPELANLVKAKKLLLYELELMDASR